MQNKIFGLILILSFSLVFASNVLAHGSVYYDYSPDPWQSQRFSASSASSIEQVFQPRVDIVLEGFDFWLDNTGSSGSINFTLLNSLGSVLATKSVNIATTAQSAGGTKVHVDLSSGVELSSSNTYSIRFSSYPSGLGIYYANTLSRFLTHNEVFVSEFLFGKARVDGVDEEFTFKYALYGYLIDEASQLSVQSEESAEETAQDLIISGARIASVTANSATLAWTTNKAADSGATAREQLNPLYVISSAYDNTMELEHAITLTGLKKNFSYFADIYSTDSSGETVSTFTISFKTSAVEDGPTEEDSEAFDEDLADTQDQSPVQELDEDEEGSSSAEETILADDEGDVGPGFDFGDEVTVEQVGQPDFSGGNKGSAGFFISWTESALGPPSSGYRVDIFDNNHRLIKQFILSPNIRTQEISGLLNGNYKAIVYSNDGGVYKKVAASDFLVSEEGSGLRTMFLVIAPILLILGLIWFLWHRRKKANLSYAEKEASR